MNIFKIIIFAILTIFLSGFLSSCHSVGSNINSLEKRLAYQQVRVVKNNNYIFLVLPNRVFFNSNSANFTDQAYKTLDLVFELTDRYEKSVIFAKGFAKNSTMAAERAHRVAQYLWKSEVNTSFIYSDVGYMPEIKNCVVIGFKK